MPPKKSKANQALGKAIRAIRKQQGYTQETFALQADIDRSYYGAIERGEPWGVWGGQLFFNGKILAQKRKRGRPPKIPRGPGRSRRA